MGERRTARRRVLRLEDDRSRSRLEHLVVEEPMEIRVDGTAVAVTMRTPGDDFALAAGFCLTEGLVAEPGEIAGIRYCAGADETGRNTFNVVDVATRSQRPVDPDLRRHVYTTSSCGVCGTASLDAVRKATASVADDPLRLDPPLLIQLPDRLIAHQRLFARTGGLHAAGVFDAAGEPRCVREDVGRHNAVDKVIGWAATEDALPLREHVLVVSGRIAFEIAQKALVAGIPAIVAVSAPSSLAVELAADAGMTMVGFVRDGACNVYAGAERLR